MFLTSTSLIPFVIISVVIILSLIGTFIIVLTLHHYQSLKRAQTTKKTDKDCFWCQLTLSEKLANADIINRQMQISQLLVAEAIELEKE